MQDTIILGNGTSKQIKTASLPDSYAEFKSMAENGNLFADIKLNADGCEVVGTPLNKQNLLTDETAGKIGNPENIDKAIKNLYSTINGIPVDLTGIYNTQVIGYDEEQGKLVPMINVARTLTIVPSSLDPKPWEITELNNCTIISGSKRIEVSLSAKGLTNFKGFFKNPYMLSEFATMNIECNFPYSGEGHFLKLSFSKQPDFSTIDAEYQIITSTASIGIINLIGKYYIKFEMQENFSSYSPSYGYYISNIKFS